MNKVLTHFTDTPDDRIKIFKKLTAPVKRYKVHFPNGDLQVIAILNICAEIKLKQFSASLEEMQNVLTLFGDYTAVPSENQLSAVLKLCNTLANNIDEPFFVETNDRVKELNLKIHTTRKQEEPVIDLSTSPWWRLQNLPLTSLSSWTISMG